MNHETLFNIERASGQVVFLSLAIATLLYWGANFWRENKLLSKLATAVAIISVAACLSIFVCRAYQADEVRIPLTSLYEFSICFVMGVVLSFLLASRKWNLRSMAHPILAIAIIVYLLGAREYRAVEETIMPALRSPWRNIHILTAMLSYGPLAVAFVTGSMALWKFRQEKRHPVKKPAKGDETDGEQDFTGDQLDEITYRIIAFSFPWLTALLTTGAIWAEEAWGTWWAWDPKEVWSMITWIIYAVYLHARLVRKWKGSTSAALAVIGFALVLFTWLGVNWIAKVLDIQGLHNY